MQATAVVTTRAKSKQTLSNTGVGGGGGMGRGRPRNSSNAFQINNVTFGLQMQKDFFFKFVVKTRTDAFLMIKTGKHLNSPKRSNRSEL